MSRFYVDSSVALHALLPGGDVRAARWFDERREADDEVFSATLLEMELTRVLRREGLDVELARPVLERCELVSIDDTIIRAAGAIEPHVKSLDAIHLATCRLLGPEVTMATHDSGMAQVAGLLGIAVVDPIGTRA